MTELIDILATTIKDQDTVKVLDHGYVMLIDCMPRCLEPGTTMDSAVADAARVSYQKGTTKRSTDEQLIRYLIRHRHTSPLEMCEFKFELKLPIFVARQLVRHRTASLNEESARYSQLAADFYCPPALRAQSTNNKQATEDDSLFNPRLETKCDCISDGKASCVIEDSSNYAYYWYEKLLAAGVSREQARMILPVNIYTSMVWKMDMLNLFKFLQLRLDKHAQWEIRVYAEAMASFVKQLAPISWQAFQEYWMDSITLSRAELLHMQQNNLTFNQTESPIQYNEHELSKSEVQELLNKLNCISET